MRRSAARDTQDTPDTGAAIVTTTFRAAELSPSELQDKPLAPPTAVAQGEVMTRSRVSFTSDDERILVGTWECEPGVSRWEFVERGEAIHVLSGRMTVQRDGQEPVDVEAGTSAVFPIGWCGAWTVHETLRKVYVIYRQ